jgi:hypothetical protein
MVFQSGSPLARLKKKSKRRARLYAALLLASGNAAPDAAYRMTKLVVTSPTYAPQDDFWASKHSRQYTGLSSRGLKGTSASLPQAEQVTEYISLGPSLR